MPAMGNTGCSTDRVRRNRTRRGGEEDHKGGQTLTFCLPPPVPLPNFRLSTIRIASPSRPQNDLPLPRLRQPLPRAPPRPVSAGSVFIFIFPPFSFLPSFFSLPLAQPDTDLATLLTVLRASPTSPTGEVLPLLSFRSSEDLQQFALGCDQDLGTFPLPPFHLLLDLWTDAQSLAWFVGGKSTVALDLGPEGKGRFYGRLSNDLNPGRRKEGVIERGGYAGFRNKVRSPLLPLFLFLASTRFRF